MAEDQKRPREQIALGIAQDAEAYRLAAVKIEPGGDILEVDLQMAIPAWHLLSHAAELAFKAYLLSHGIADGFREGELKHPALRHCLLPLLEMAIRHNFRPPSDAFGDVIEQLDPYHRVIAGGSTMQAEATQPPDIDALEHAWHGCVREAYVRQPRGQSRAGAQRNVLDECREHEDALIAAVMDRQSGRDDLAYRYGLLTARAGAWAASVAAYVVNPLTSWFDRPQR